MQPDRTSKTRVSEATVRRVLSIVCQRGPVRRIDVREALDLSGNAVSLALRRLVDRKLAVRTTPRWSWAPTAAGRTADAAQSMPGEPLPSGAEKSPDARHLEKLAHITMAQGVIYDALIDGPPLSSAQLDALVIAQVGCSQSTAKEARQGMRCRGELDYTMCNSALYPTTRRDYDPVYTLARCKPKAQRHDHEHPQD